jgi:ABC-2 type transport system permease protein
MNHRGGLALVRSTWASWMQYRGFFFVLAFGWMVPPLVALFVWSAAAAKQPIAGLERGEFVAYYLVLILVNQITYAQANWTVGDVIREGGINTWLLRPIPAVYHTLSSELAGKVVYMAFDLPVVAILALVLHPELHATWSQAGLFVLALILAWALRFLWGYWLALLAFWSSRADALLALQDSLVFLLSGVVAPVSLLPGVLQTVGRLLPFRYMVGFPVEILVQGLPVQEIATGFAFQLVWLGVALVLSRWMWVNGLRRYSAVGG